MPTRVKIYHWRSEDDPMPLSEDDWTMYELPAAGVRYWHGTDGFRVREVDESQSPPVVHLNYDYDWMRDVQAQLPEGYTMDGGRSAHDGEWHFHAVTPEHGRPLGPEFADDLDEAMAQAITNAREHYRLSQQSS